MESKRVVIMRGLPGSGKSTHVKALIEEARGDTHTEVRVCSSDAFFIDLDTGEYKCDPKKFGESHAHCFRTFLSALQDKIGVIVVDNVNSRLWEYQNYAQAAKMMGYSVSVVEFRVATREQLKVCVKRQTHGVPVEAILRFWFQWEDNTLYPTATIPVE